MPILTLNSLQLYSILMLIFLVLFFLSGFASLIYEIAWARLLSISFGSTTIANTLVITAYMLGLGLGGLVFGKLVDKKKNPMQIFSLLQMGTALFSLILVILLPRFPFLYRHTINLIQTNQLVINLTIFFWAFIIIFIPAFFMGGTLPVITRGYVTEPERMWKGIGYLYGINTLGGVIGAILAGFFLIRNIGLVYTQLVAIAINVLVAVSALGITVESPAKAKVKDSIISKHEEKTKSIGFALTRYIPVIAGMTGFAGLACEIYWIRALSMFLTNSTYSFTIILIVFLTGIFLGSIIFTRISTKHNLYNMLALCQILNGMYIIIGSLFLNKLPAVLFAMESVLRIPLFRMVLPALILSVFVIFVPTLFMGISFPAMCSLYGNEIRHLGNKIGRVYFANTLGSALGALFTGIFLLSLLGVIRGLLITAFINLVIGALFTMGMKKVIPNLILVGCSVIISIFAFPNRYILPPSIYHTLSRADRVLYYRETTEGTIVASEDRRTGIKSCYVNNSAVIGTTYDAIKVVRMLGNLPFLFNPQAKEALVIGFGVGITTSAIARYNVKQIDCVEICPGLREAARYFASVNNNIFNNPRVNFISGDGRNFLLLTNKQYDIISCDPTHPILGSGNLYTKQYFALCRSRIRENGVVCQYLPFHKLSPFEFRSLIKTFASVFPYTSIWLGHSHGILIGTNFPQIISFEQLKAIKDDLLSDPYLVAVSYLLDSNAVTSLITDAAVNTDDRPILEFFTPTSLRHDNWELNIRAVYERRIDINQVIIGIDDYGKIQRYLEAQHYFINGLIFQNQRVYHAMKEEFLKALAINPENDEIRSFLNNP